MVQSKLFLLAASMLALLAFTHATFEERLLEVSIIANPDGSAHVEESIQMFITNSQSIDLYKSTRIYNDLATWRDRTGLRDIQNHITRSAANIENLRVRPGPVERCNALAQTCHATLVWEYDVIQMSPDQPGFIRMDNYKPRTTRFSINREALGVPTSERGSIILSNNGDIILSNTAVLRITIPQAAKKIYVSKLPSSFSEADSKFIYDPQAGKKHYVGDARTFAWSGETLSQFEFTYELEQSLEDEIASFFRAAQASVFGLLTSMEGAALILISSIIFLSAIALHGVSRSVR